MKTILVMAILLTPVAGIPFKPNGAWESQMWEECYDLYQRGYDQLGWIDRLTYLIECKNRGWE